MPSTVLEPAAAQNGNIDTVVSKFGWKKRLYNRRLYYEYLNSQSQEYNILKEQKQS